MEKIKMLHLSKFSVLEEHQEKDKSYYRFSVAAHMVDLIKRDAGRKEEGCEYRMPSIVVETRECRFILTDTPETRAYLAQFFDIEDSLYAPFEEKKHD